MGIVIMTLLIDGPPNNAPPSTDGAMTWKNQYGIQSAYVAADPTYSMVTGNQVGTPQQTIVDPRTMKVKLVIQGWSGDYPALLTTLANQNKGG